MTSGPGLDAALRFFCFASSFSKKNQKHGLKVYMRDPHAFTPMLEEGVKGAPPRSLTLGSVLATNQMEIGKFSQKDAKVI